MLLYWCFSYNEWIIGLYNYTHLNKPGYNNQGKSSNNNNNILSVLCLSSRFFLLTSSGLVVTIFSLICLSVLGLVQILRHWRSIFLSKEIVISGVRAVWFIYRLHTTQILKICAVHTSVVRGSLIKTSWDNVFYFQVLTKDLSFPQEHVSHLMYSSRTYRAKKSTQTLFNAYWLNIIFLTNTTWHSVHFIFKVLVWYK